MNPNSAAKKLMPPPKMNADASTDSSLKAPKRIRLRHKRKDSTPAKVAQVSQNVAMDVALNNPNPIPLSSSSESSVAMSVQCHNLDVDADDSEIASNASNEFNDLDISANTKKAIVTQLKYKTMTPVQTASIPVILEGKDVVVKAKTGTGKTIAFLVPAIDVLIKEKARYQKNLRSIDRQDLDNSKDSAKPSPPIILILSPTRELAQQISTEATVLATYHPFEIVTLVGGTSIDSDKRALNRPSGVDIIVATPGRLLQHLEETKGMVNMCKASKVLIFDEADRLLDMGFKRDIDKIVNYLKPVTTSRDAENPMNKFTRQTLLFSATFSNEIKEIASQALRKGYEVIDTVGEEEEQTHAHIPQSMIVASLDNQMEVLSKLIAQQMTMPQYKVIVFFPTARQTGFFAELFNAADASTITSVAGKAVDHLPILEIHSRKSQAQRTRASDQFRSSANAILFSSDVTARGMDYPDVTLVIQIGMTSRDQYIHRIGRTGRAGKEGDGVIVCFPDEELLLRQELQDLPLVVRDLQNFTSTVVCDTVGAAAARQQQQSVENIQNKFYQRVSNVLTQLRSDRQSELQKSADQAWGAWLGFYNGYTRKLRWTSNDLVSTSKLFATSMGLQQIPALPKRTLAKMGLLNAEGLRIEPKESSSRSDGEGRGGRGRGGGSEGGERQQQQRPQGGGGGRGGGGGNNQQSRPTQQSARPSNVGANTNTAATNSNRQRVDDARAVDTVFRVQQPQKGREVTMQPRGGGYSGSSSSQSQARPQPSPLHQRPATDSAAEPGRKRVNQQSGSADGPRPPPRQQKPPTQGRGGGGRSSNQNQSRRRED